MNLITNPEAINMAVPAYRIDNIIGIHTGSFAIAANGGTSTTASQSFTTGFGDTCLFQGVYSIDGGASWNDLGAMKPITSGSNPVLQTTTCYGYVSATGVFTATALNFINTAYTVQYKVAFFAKDDQGLITPLPTNEVLQYSSKYNFQKIFESGSFSNGSSSTVIAHGLNYVPKVRVWIVPSGSTLSAAGFLTIPAGALVTPDWFYTYSSNNLIFVDSSNVTIQTINNGSTVSGEVIYRIYLDS